MAGKWADTSTGGKLANTAKGLAAAAGEAAEKALDFVGDALKGKGKYGGGAGRVDAQKYAKK